MEILMKNNRRKKMLVFDIETAETTENAIAYDIGFAVVDKKGNIYEEHSYLAYEIFCEEPDLMSSAYYSVKIPEYKQGVREGKHEIRRFMTVWKILREVLKKYNIKEVYAYNASFDLNGLNRTLRWLSGSKYRYFFPYGTKVFCIWHMACQVLYTQKAFIRMAVANGWISEKGNIQTSAEVGYRYMTGNTDFEEEHKGLDDVRIETAILVRCLRQHKAINRNINKGCWRIPQKAYKEMYSN